MINKYPCKSTASCRRFIFIAALFTWIGFMFSIFVLFLSKQLLCRIQHHWVRKDKYLFHSFVYSSFSLLLWFILLHISILVDECQSHLSTSSFPNDTSISYISYRIHKNATVLFLVSVTFTCHMSHHPICATVRQQIDIAMCVADKTIVHNFAALLYTPKHWHHNVHLHCSSVLLDASTMSFYRLLILQYFCVIEFCCLRVLICHSRA